MVGILVSFWDGLFSGAMLVSGSVHLEFHTNHSLVLGVYFNWDEFGMVCQKKIETKNPSRNGKTPGHRQRLSIFFSLEVGYSSWISPQKCRLTFQLMLQSGVQIILTCSRYIYIIYTPPPSFSKLCCRTKWQFSSTPKWQWSPKSLRFSPLRRPNPWAFCEITGFTTFQRLGLEWRPFEKKTGAPGVVWLLFFFFGGGI